MYYPLLRARQFELIALRELAIEGATQGVIIPIIDPVKETHNNLNLAYDVFYNTNQKAYLILNPGNGEMSGDGMHYLEYISTLEEQVYLPAFKYHSNGSYIKECIEKNNLTDCMIVCHNDVNVMEADFTDIATHDSVVAFNVEDPGRNRSLSRYIRSLNKTFIRLDDLFERQQRNSDFLTINEHPYSEEHLYFIEDKFNGFSDYTTIPSDYIEGGSAPRAVVIHLTYLNDQNQMLIRHFTSNTNDSIANVQGKFAEAAEKAVSFCRKKGLNNSALMELFENFDQQHYPGLGTVKKLSIKNHLLVLSSFLRNR
jgi:hypothetical protein